MPAPDVTRLQVWEGLAGSPEGRMNVGLAALPRGAKFLVQVEDSIDVVAPRSIDLFT